MSAIRRREDADALQAATGHSMDMRRLRNGSRNTTHITAFHHRHRGDKEGSVTFKAAGNRFRFFNRSLQQQVANKDTARSPRTLHVHSTRVRDRQARKQQNQNSDLGNAGTHVFSV